MRARPLKVAHPTVEQRVAAGRAARSAVPRRSLATFASDPGRDPLALLQRQAETRLPDLVPIRYGRMATSPFAFLRGAALPMAADLAASPHSGLRVQLCGDAHLSNFGIFASPDRRLVFDLNDFDETLPGPFEWDVKRLVASAEVAARQNGFTVAQCADAVLVAGGVYRRTMHELSELPNLAVWYGRIEAEEEMRRISSTVKPAVREQRVAVLDKARTQDSHRALRKLTRVVDGERRFVSRPPLLVPLDELLPDVEASYVFERLMAVLRSYRRSLQSDRRHLLEQYRLVQVARKVVGVGSVGTRAWVCLMVGRDDGDPLFLQIKEAQVSVLEAFAGRSTYPNQGQRVVAGQRLMQAASDIFLGSFRTEGIDGVQRDFYVRQLKDWKGSADVDAMTPGWMCSYLETCARALARAHARSGDRVAISAYLGSSDRFERSLVTFASSYADQTEKDHAALVDAIARGEIEALAGV